MTWIRAIHPFRRPFIFAISLVLLRMFSNIEVSAAEARIEKGLDVSKMAVWVELSLESITFLQYRVPEIIEQLFDLQYRCAPMLPSDVQ